MDGKAELGDWHSDMHATLAADEATAIAMDCVIRLCPDCADWEVEIENIICRDENYLCIGTAAYRKASGTKQSFTFECELERRVDHHGDDYFIEFDWLISEC